MNPDPLRMCRLNHFLQKITFTHAWRILASAGYFASHSLDQKENIRHLSPCAPCYDIFRTALLHVVRPHPHAKNTHCVLPFCISHQAVCQIPYF